MVIRLKWFCLLSLLLLGASASAQPAAEPGTERLDLAGAMRLARERAPEVAAALARQEAARQRLREARGWRLPQVRLSETWARTDAPADVFGFLLNQERFSFAEFVASDPNAPEPLSTGMTRLELEVPVWTGGELATRVEQAGLAAEAAAHRAGWSADQAALAAADAWVRLAQARERVALLERSRETVAAHVELARAYADEGMVVRSELLRAEVELARMDDLLTEARGQARVAQAGLAFRLGLPLDSRFELAPLPDPPPVAAALETWLASAAARRDLEEARRLLAAGELEVRARRAGRLPRVGVVGRYDLVDDHPFGAHGDSSAILAVASFDLWSGGRKAAAEAAARADAEAGRRDVERFEEGVRLGVRQALEEALVARDRQATARRALATAAEAVRITEERYRSGVTKTIDLLDAATARREAEMRELVARADAHLAALRLAVEAGRTPESALAAPTTTEGGQP